MHVEDRDPSTLNRPEWNSLVKNYDKHDVGDEYLQWQFDRLGVDIEEWGIDMRHQEDALIYDDRMDLKVWVPTEEEPHEDVEFRKVPVVDQGRVVDWQYQRLAAILDVKTKTSDSWFGIYNERHYQKYCNISEEYDVPVVVAMFLLTTENGRSWEIGKEAYIPILGQEQTIKSKFRAPDGNRVVQTDEEFYNDWDWFESQLLLDD